MSANRPEAFLRLQRLLNQLYYYAKNNQRLFSQFFDLVRIDIQNAVGRDNSNNRNVFLNNFEKLTVDDLKNNSFVNENCYNLFDMINQEPIAVMVNDIFKYI